MRISEIFSAKRPVFSFEFFPPKTDKGAENLMKTVADLQTVHAPDFVSVTYGAGGSTRERTLQIVADLQRDLGITAMAHHTCVAATPDQIHENMTRLAESGIQNVLALRGDPPQGEEEFVPPENGFGHATELIEFLKEKGFDFDVGAACYPESHLESASPEEDMRWTKEKVDLGARFLISQIFFDNDHYFTYCERARAAGIDVPIVPGIMPITNVAQIERFTKMCGAQIPEELHQRLLHYQDDPSIVMAIGIEHAIRQCRRLLEAGAPGVHFYTLNKSHATRCVLAAIKG